MDVLTWVVVEQHQADVSVPNSSGFRASGSRARRQIVHAVEVLINKYKMFTDFGTPESSLIISKISNLYETPICHKALASLCPDTVSISLVVSQ